jgi:ligand-binding sensor domain-containing protein
LIRTLLLYILFFSYPLSAQEPVVFQFTEKDGLPDIEFYNGIEDSKGFIWLAADKGFYRFDGKDFKNYSNQEKRGLSVFEPFEDKTGRIWCVNISGQLFYIENDKLITFIDLGSQFKGELVKYIVRDSDVLVFSMNKILSVHLKSKKIITIANSLKSIGSPFRYNKKTIVCIDNQVYSINENHLVKEEILKPHRKLTNNETQSVFFQLQDNLFLLRQSLAKVKEQVLYLKKTKFEEIQIPSELKNKRLNCFFEKDNLIWFCTNEGVYVYTFENQKFIFKKRILEHLFVTKTLVDNDENYWLTSLKSGVYVIPNININLQNFTLEYGGISCIDKIDENHFVFGTTNGKSGIYNVENNEIKEIKLMSENKVTAVMFNSFSNEIFISQEDNSGIYKSGIYTEKKTFINAKKLSFIDKKTFIYATYNGAFVVDNQKKESIILGNKSTYKRTYTSHSSLNAQKKHIGYVDGLVVYDKKLNAKTINYKGKSIFAIAITETKDGIVWVSTFKDGVFGILNDEVQFNLNESNGLISNQTGIIKADGDNIWIATDKGIQFYNSTTKKFKTLTKTDGISSYNITGIEIFNEKVVFSSNMGLLFIDKEKVFKQLQTTTIYFTSVEVNEELVKLKSNYEWNYDNNSVKFSFNTNGFKSNEKHQYKYRLVGLNDKWITIDKGIDFVKYNSLPAGNYIFQIDYLQNNGSKKVQQIQFEIKTPFWQKWWFYIIIIALFIGLAVVYFNLKLQDLKKKQEEELQKELISKKLVFSQLEALRSQMNPHFIFNALNSIQEYIVFNNKELASNYLVKFSRLIRIYLEHSQQNEIVLKEEVNALKIYLELEKIRFEDILDYDLYIDENLMLEQIKIPSLFIQPYVENAIKHGLLHKLDDRKLKVSFQKEKLNNYLVCTIEDNGIGRNASLEINKNKTLQHQSFATSANEKRLELINLDRAQKIVVEIVDLYSNDNESKGTKIIIKIPLNK